MQYHPVEEDTVPLSRAEIDAMLQTPEDEMEELAAKIQEALKHSSWPPPV